jgi:peptidoglycan/LPS O-acetylase OafA/YrhL
LHHRRDELDGLRAVAVLLVIGFHASGLAFLGGWIGVDIFFVLSGYLITTILTAEFERSGTIEIGMFYLRRTLRLAPALLVLLSVNLLMAMLFAREEHRSEHIGATAAAFFYAMNWIRAFRLPYEGHISHVWSLAIEEQFYLIWPLLLWFALARGGRRAARITVCVLISAIVLWRIYLALNGAPPFRTYNGFDTRADTLFIGCLLALGANPPEILRRLWFIPVLSLTFIAAFTPWDARWVHIGGFDLIALCAAWIISAIAERGLVKSLLSIRTLVFIGSISYGMYLWHAFFTHILFQKDVPTGYVLIAILPLTLVFAITSYFMIEKPFLDRKDRLRMKHPVPAPTAASSAGIVP